MCEVCLQTVVLLGDQPDWTALMEALAVPEMQANQFFEQCTANGDVLTLYVAALQKLKVGSWLISSVRFR